MARNRKSPARKTPKKAVPITETLPGLLVSALAQDQDFILCYETDEDTGKRTLHVMTGSFVTPCMLRKLIGQAESQKDEGSTLTSRTWTPRKNA